MRTQPAAVSMASVIWGLVGTCGLARAQPADDLAQYFGFEEGRTIVVDDGCGPVTRGDFNADGRPDLLVVNNAKSRIELHLLRERERTPEEIARGVGRSGGGAAANELPPNPWYDKEEISVPQRVTAVRVHDFNGDGKADILYAGDAPKELVVLRQDGPGKFTAAVKKRVRDLAARQSGLEIADVMGDGSLEVLALAGDRILAFEIGADGTLGESQEIPAGGKELVAFFVEDFSGDGLKDVVGVVPDDSMPIRLWSQQQDPRVSAKSGLLAAQRRFEMPAVREVEPIVFPGRPGASLGVIERATRRLVCYDAVRTSVESASGEREVQAEVFAFTDGSNQGRSVAVDDLDGDGRVDVLATDTKGNTVVVYTQVENVGLLRGEAYSAFKQPKTVALGQWSGSPAKEVFVLSEEEKTVGVAEYDAAARRLAFPTPVLLKTPAASPVAMAYVTISPPPQSGELGAPGAPPNPTGTDSVAAGAQGALAVVVKNKRDHTLELHRPDGTVTAVTLEKVSRPPQSILGADADQDGVQDLLLFTPGEPMVMVRATGAPAAAGAEKSPAAGQAEGAPSGFQVLTDQDMKNFGLVQAAGPANTALLDADADGRLDLLIADKNFVRGCAYDAARGWRVVAQCTIPDTGTDLAGVAVLTLGGRETIVAADKGNDRLLLIEADAPGGSKPEWKVTSRIKLSGFSLGAIRAGAFGGDGQPSVLCLSDDAFAVVRFSGERLAFEPFTAYRSDAKNRSEHDMEPGDLNADGYTDLAVLDAGEQMCSILTFTAKRDLRLATEFKVFDSKIFSGGDRRELEPRDVMVCDLTGDSYDDLCLVVHDRVIVYPQMRPPR